MGPECRVDEGRFPGRLSVFYSQSITGHYQRAGDIQPDVIIAHRNACLLAQLKAVSGIGVDGVGEPGQIGVCIVRLGLLQRIAQKQAACCHQTGLAGDVHIAARILCVNPNYIAVLILNQLFSDLKRIAVT